MERQPRGHPNDLIHGAPAIRRLSS